MPADWVTKQGDTGPALTDKLTYSDGTVVDLTGNSLQFVARNLASTQPLNITGTVTSPAPKAGDLQFIPSAEDNATPGIYIASWVITTDSGQMTWPTEGYNTWRIEESAGVSSPAQLVSLGEVKDHLHIPAQERNHDSQLIDHIEAITSLIENITGPIIPRSFDEWHSAGQYSIRLKRRPSSAIGSDPILTLMGVEEYRGPTRYPLTIVGDPVQASTYSVMLDPQTATIYRRTTGGGVIAFGAGAFGGGMPCGVHVSYQAGQRSIPANVRRAAIEAIRVNYQTTMAVGRGSRTRSDETDVGPPLGFYLPRRCLELLAPNRRHPTIA